MSEETERCEYGVLGCPHPQLGLCASHERDALSERGTTLSCGHDVRWLDASVCAWCETVDEVRRGSATAVAAAYEDAARIAEKISARWYALGPEGAGDPAEEVAAAIRERARNSSSGAIHDKALERVDETAGLNPIESSSNHRDRTEPKAEAGIDLVRAERQRQIDVERWSPQHDDDHDIGQLSAAGACYALYDSSEGDEVPDEWPWDESDWKPKDTKRNLVRAAALIVADLDRILRDEQEATRIRASMRTPPRASDKGK